jgi:lysophospholipase L1-like esterase
MRNSILVILLALASCDHISSSWSMVLCGDSTMAAYNGENGYVGWGEFVGVNLSDDLAIYNRALPGASAERFRVSALAGALALRADFALVQFGHNSADSLSESMALDSIIAAFRRAGTQVVLVTPMCNRDNIIRFPKLDGAVRNASSRHNVPLIPLDSLSNQEWSELGESARKNAFFDITHLNVVGASRVAMLVAARLVDIIPEIAP